MNGHVLDVKAGNANAGAEIIMWNRKQQPSKNQLWYLDQQGFIRSALNDFALEAREYTHAMPDAWGTLDLVKPSDVDGFRWRCMFANQ
jgi:hypothetical protein